MPILATLGKRLSKWCTIFTQMLHERQRRQRRRKYWGLEEGYANGIALRDVYYDGYGVATYMDLPGELDGVDDDEDHNDCDDDEHDHNDDDLKSKATPAKAERHPQDARRKKIVGGPVILSIRKPDTGDFRNYREYRDYRYNQTKKQRSSASCDPFASPTPLCQAPSTTTKINRPR